MIAPGVHAGDGRRGKAAQTVRLEPFAAECGVEIGQISRSNFIAIHRSAVVAFRLALSSRSDGWRQLRSRRLRGNIHKKAPGRASAGPLDTGDPCRAPDVGPPR